MKLHSLAAIAFLNFLCALPVLAGEAPASASGPRWNHLSSKTGDLPVPGPSTEQTGALAADFDGDGIDDFVLAFRKVAPALVWYRRTAEGWSRSVIDPDFLTVEAGGVAWDVDGDGDLDIIFGGDWQSKDVWWWENPSPNFDPKVPWKRRLIKTGGATQHHDQAMADFRGVGKAQLAFWNQGAKTIFLADIPADPRSSGPWKLTSIFTGSAGEKGGVYPEGMAAIDVDGDGVEDLLAGNCWFKHEGGDRFRPIKVSPIGGYIVGGRLKPGKCAQIVIGPGDGVGPLKWFECTGDPLRESDWVGHDLAGRDLVHGHTLELGDVDGDGRLDIFAAEMAQWTEGRPQPDNPGATAWIFYGDGRGGFRKTELAKGMGFHDGRLADLDGDGDLDVLDKPYTWQAPRVDVWLNGGTGPRAHGIGPFFRGPLGLALYSLRADLKKDVPGTLKRAREMGFVEVEVAGFLGTPVPQLHDELEKVGLRSTSYIATYEALTAGIPAVVRDAKMLGAAHVVCPWIPHQAAFTADAARKAAADFDRWGAELAEAGLRFSYHIHGFEFIQYENGTLFDLLARETRPERVGFEMDVFWVVRPGQDPAKLLLRYPGRFPLLHLKDMEKGRPTGDTSGSAPEEWSVPLGTGQIDFPALLRAARVAGVERYYLEDEAPNVNEQIPRSLRYLEKVSF